MKGKQTHIRKLWTINILLNGEEKNQTQIVNELNQIGENLYQMNLYPYGIDKTEANQLIKTTKAIETPIIKDLTNKKIIKGELKDLKGSNLKANFCSIPFNHVTFLKILKEIENSIVDESQKNFFISKLINSPLGQKNINDELITSLLQKQEILDVEFNKNEKNLIIFILRNSPQALSYTIKSIQNLQKEWKINEAKDYYLYKIQTLLNLDLLDQYLIPSENESRQKIQFKTSISFKPDINVIGPISTKVNSENMYFSFSQHFNKEKTIDQIYNNHP